MPNDRPAQPPAHPDTPGPAASETDAVAAGTGHAASRPVTGAEPVTDGLDVTTPPTRINPNAGKRPAPAAEGAGGPVAPTFPRALDLATADYIGARSQQQDATQAQLIAGNTGALLVLADGLGGHESGAEAARIVVDTFVEAAVNGMFDPAPARRSALREALDKANGRIATGLNPGHGQRSMASTAVAAIVADGALQWVSVGDSHLYVWRKGELLKLNQDHSQAGLMIRSGQYAPDDPEVLAAKSVLVSALTGRKLELVDHPAEAFRLELGDVLLLASDGLNTLTEHEVETIVTGEQTGGAARLSKVLLETVVERRADRQDNTTVAIARVLEIPSRAAGIPLNDIESLPRDLTRPTRHADSLTEAPARDPRSSGTGGDSKSTEWHGSDAQTKPARTTASTKPVASSGRRTAVGLLTALFITCALALAVLASVYGLYGSLDPIRDIALTIQSKLGLAPAGPGQAPGGVAPVPSAVRAPVAPGPASPRPPSEGTPTSPAAPTPPLAAPGTPPTVSPGHVPDAKQPSPAQPQPGERGSQGAAPPPNGRVGVRPGDPALVEPPRPVAPPAPTPR